MIRRLGRIAASLVAVLALGGTLAAVASAEVSPELFYKVKGTAIVQAVGGQGKIGISLWRVRIGEEITTECRGGYKTYIDLPGGHSDFMDYYEGCKIVEPASLAAKCTVPSMMVTGAGYLVYEPGTSKILELLKPPAGSTTFTEYTVDGSECALAGKHPIKGTVLARLSPERTEKATGEEIFSTHEGTQSPHEYEEVEKSGLKSSTAITFSGEPMTLEGGSTDELISKEEWGVF